MRSVARESGAFFVRKVPDRRMKQAAVSDIGLQNFFPPRLARSLFPAHLRGTAERPCRCVGGSICILHENHSNAA